jgi:hypothetical protein
MEVTGIYLLPILSYLQEKGIFVAVINPCLSYSTTIRSRPAITEVINKFE